MQTKKVKILEISPALHFTGSKVVQMLSAVPWLAEKIDLCYAPVGEISDRVWSEFQRSTRLPINRIDWSTLLPEQLQIQFDLVMFNGSVASIPFVDNKILFKKWLNSFSDKLVKPQGFFMMNEYVNQLDLMNHIQRLERVCSKQEQVTYTFQSEQEWRKVFEQSTGFYPVALKANPALSTLFFYRRQHVPTQAYPGSSIQRPVIKEAELHVNDFESLVWLDKAKQAINDATIERVWVISQTAPTPIALLIVKQIRAQPKLDRLRFIFIADTPSNSVPVTVFYENIKRADLVVNVYKNGKWGSYSKQQETAALTTTTTPKTPIELRDTIQSLSELRELIKNEITRRQELKTLSTADEQRRFVSLQIQPTSSQSSTNLIQLTPSVSIKFEPTREVAAQQKQPQTPFSFNYTMAHYALMTRGGLKQTHSVLIHDGFTPIGQMAISIALKNAGQVYVTVRNLDEMKQLEKQFQQQQQTRSTAVLRVIPMSDFERTVMQMTAGQGVDIVFNNIDEKHQASFNVLCTNGRFLDVETQKGSTDSKRKSTAWELPLLNKPISYFPITADALKEPENMVHWQKVQNCIKEAKDIQQVALEAIQLFEQTKNSLKSVAQQFKQPLQQQQQQTKFNLMPKRVFEKLNEFESRQTSPVIIVHSIEGHASMLKGLAKNMKFPVYGLQFTQEALKYDTVERLAEFYLQQIDNRFPVGTGVHLIGYGFGGLVAVEMASRKPSRFETLSFLDGPSRHQQQMKYVNFDYETQAQQESEWLWGFVNQYNTSVAKTHTQNQLVYILSSMNSTEKRIKYVVENFLLTSQFQFEQNDAEMAARAYITKLKMAQQYRPSTELCFDELLIVKPAQRVVEAFQEDFDLTGVFNGRVHVQIVDGEHRTFLESTSGQQVARILNEYLAQF
jgi:thioesterase domain-containing protein